MISYKMYGVIAVIRDLSNENLIEIKRTFEHPNYQYPATYDDVVLLELGRRITFDYDRVSYVHGLSMMS